jgi:hypothetical protein
MAVLRRQGLTGCRANISLPLNIESYTSIEKNSMFFLGWHLEMKIYSSETLHATPVALARWSVGTI